MLIDSYDLDANVGLGMQFKNPIAHVLVVVLYDGLDEVSLGTR